MLLRDADFVKLLTCCLLFVGFCVCCLCFISGLIGIGGFGFV